MPADKPIQRRRGAPVGATAGPKDSLGARRRARFDSGETISQDRLRSEATRSLRRQETSEEADGSPRRTVNDSRDCKAPKAGAGGSRLKGQGRRNVAEEAARTGSYEGRIPPTKLKSGSSDRDEASPGTEGRLGLLCRELTSTGVGST